MRLFINFQTVYLISTFAVVYFPCLFAVDKIEPSLTQIFKHTLGTLSLKQLQSYIKSIFSQDRQKFFLY